MFKYSVHDPEKYKDKGIKSNYYLRFDDGPYEGIEFTADNIRIDPDISEDKAVILFDLDILYSPPHIKEVTQPEFDMAVGEIITTILTKIVDANNDEVFEEIGEDLGEARIEDLQKDAI